MFLIAGLVGMVVSGIMMIAPRPLDDDPRDSDGSLDQGDLLSDESPASPLPSQGDGSDGADAPTGPLMDMLTGVYGSDVVGGSQVAAITHQGDATFGSLSAETIEGGAQSDLIFGNEGDDHLSGGDGRDELVGGEGDDGLFGGASGDILWGDDGNDDVSGGDGDDLIVGGEGDDVLSGDGGDDRIFGQSGNDLLEGGEGNDILDGTDVAVAPGQTGDLLRGGSGDDTLAGDGGDTLSGGSGADTHLVSGPGLEADAGPQEVPRIIDFDVTEDQIEITHDGPAPTITFAADDTGTTILADGTAVAHVDHVFALTTDHVGLVPLGPGA